MWPALWLTASGGMIYSLCDRHKGVGGYGIALLERSEKADAAMRLFNRDGS